MDVGFWGLLHDGGIDAIYGNVPGTVSVKVSIQYLRQKFPGEGTGFTIELANCSELAYREYDSAMVTDVGEIVALQPEIVGVEKDGNRVVVNCVMGSLNIIYESPSIHLDTGEDISFGELYTASKTYWEEWTAKTSNMGRCSKI